MAGPTYDTIWSYTAIAVCSATFGYWIGVGNSLNISRKETSSQFREDDSDSSDGEEGSGNTKVNVVASDEFKMVLVVRGDLGMTKGKIAAQCGHATLACYKTILKTNPDLLRRWERSGQTKVALKCDSEDDLLLLQAKASSLGLCARTIQDAGRTQIAAGSTTVLGIGPAPIRLINQVTGHLKLL